MEAARPLPGNTPGSNTVDARSVILGGLPEGERFVDLALPDERYGQYNLPLSNAQLTEIMPQRDNGSLAALLDWPNVLIPMAVQRMTAEGRITPLRSGARLYLFRDGYLWRELETVTYGRTLTGFRDVNLKALYGQDTRAATCTRQSHVVLPYRMADYEPDFQIAFSEIPWSWARIQSMGGMAPDDPRNPDREDAASSDADTRRAARCTPVTFTDDTLRHARTRLERDRERPDHYVVDFRSGTRTDFLNNDVTLLLADPIQEARNLKRHHENALQVLATCVESETQGPLGLAQLIKSLTDSDDSGRLESGLDAWRHDQRMLELWDNIREDLPERVAQVESELLNVLQSDDFMVAISDYTEATDSAIRTAGLNTFLRLTQHCAEPDTLRWLHCVVDGEVPALALATGEDEDVLTHLHAHADGELHAGDNDPAWRSLSDYDKATMVAFAPLALSALLDVTANAWKQLNANDPSARLGWLERRLASIALQPIGLLMQPARHLMPAHGRATNGLYAFLPQGLVHALHQFSQRYMVQVLYNRQPLGDVLTRMENSARWQGARLSVLGSLFGLQVWFAVREMNNASQEASNEDKLNAGIAAGSLVALLSDQGRRVSERWLARIDLERSRSSSSITQFQSGNSRAIDLRARFAKHFSTIFTGLIKGVNALIGIAEGIRGFIQLRKGIISGNSGMAVGGALGLVGGVLLVIGAVKGVVALPLLALLLLTGGAVMVSAFTRSPLENALRHGWFGRKPYAIEDRAFNRPEEAQQNQTYRSREDSLRFLQWVERGRYQHWLDGEIQRHLDLGEIPEHLGNEISGIIREMHSFETTIKVYELHQDSYILGPNQRAPTPDTVIVEADISLGRFTPLSTTLAGNLKVRSTGLNYAVASDCYLCEKRDAEDQSRLAGLRVLLELPREQVVRAGVEISLQQDTDGSGQWLMPPEERESASWRWQARGRQPDEDASRLERVILRLDPKPNLYHMNQSEWARLKETATVRPESAGESWVWMDTDTDCRLVSRSEALFRPLLPNSWAAS